MARPKGQNNNRNLMLEAGISLLIDHGYHGMSIKQLVDSIGVPKGSFYNYFSSKESFTADAIERYGELKSLKISEIIRPSDSAFEAIRKTFQVLQDNFGQQNAPAPCLISALASEISQHSEICRNRLEEAQEQAKEHLTNLVRKAQSSGEMTKRLAPEAIGQLLYNNWHGQLLNYQVTGDGEQLSSQTQQLLNFLKNDP